MQGIPSKRFDVWRRLYSRFLLEPEPLVGSRAAVSTVIQPITDVDTVVSESSIRRAGFDLTGASGTFKGFTVPAGERWRPGLLHREGTTGNTHLQAELLDEDSALAVITISPNVTSEQFADVRGLILDEGERIGFVNSGNAGDGSRVLEIELQIEERN